MARNKKLAMLFARVRTPYQKVKDVIEQLAIKCERIIVFEHNERSDNIHIHFLVEGNTISTDTIKNYFKRGGFDAGEKGQHWSFNAATDRGCITYMSKGVLDPVYVKGYPKEETDELRKKWVPKSTYQTRLSYMIKETPQEAKKRKNDLLDEMIVQIEHEHDVVEIIIKVLNVNKLMCSRFVIRDYFDTIMARKFTTKFVESMKRLCQL